ncbi:hypothetical protein [Photobacterium leiognathi]|uniref:hypothetical protein n=1 Tax=Photobacterium leiognathi TaxID=553611 RepID=UPI00298272DE|nr:hypothetical protein [Photobacterium leiognathi]
MKTLITELELSHDHYSLDSQRLRHDLQKLARSQKHTQLSDHISEVLKNSDCALDATAFVTQLSKLHIDVAKLSTKRTERLRYSLQIGASLFIGGLTFLGVSCLLDYSEFLGVLTASSAALTTYLLLDSLWQSVNPYHQLLRRLSLYIQVHKVLLTFQFRPVHETLVNKPFFIGTYWHLKQYLFHFTNLANGKINGEKATLLTMIRDKAEEVAIIVDLPLKSDVYPMFYAFSATNAKPRYISHERSLFDKWQCQNHVSTQVGKYSMLTLKTTPYLGDKLKDALNEALSLLFFELPDIVIECNGSQLLLTTQYQLIPKLNFADNKISDVEVHDHLYDPITVEQLKIYPIISNLLGTIIKVCGNTAIMRDSVTLISKG